MKKVKKTVGSFEAKSHLASLIDHVQKGDEYIITRRGKPVARLVPYTVKSEGSSVSDIIANFDTIRNSVNGGVDIKEFISEGRKH